MQWERTIFVIGMFSLFEAVIQNELKIEKGSAFKELGFNIEVQRTRS